MEKSGTPYYVTPGQGQKSILDEQILRLIERELFSGRARDVVEAWNSLVMPPPSARHLTSLGCMAECAGRSPFSSQFMFISEKLGLSSLQNGRIICGALYGSLMSRSTIFLAWMGRNIAGEGLGKNFCPGTLPQQ